MWKKLRQQGSNWCSRIGLGLALCTVLVILASTNRCADQSYRSQAIAAGRLPPVRAEMTIQRELQRLAQNDPLELIRLVRQNYHKSVRDYTCTFIKQERIDGHLKDPETIRVCFKEEPFSLLMTWPKPKGLIDKLLYVENGGPKTILVHPAGLAGMLVNTVRRDINDPRLKKSSLRTPDHFGFGRILQDMVLSYNRAEKNGDLLIEYRGMKTIDGREYLLLQRKLPLDKGYNTIYASLDIYLDAEFLLPTRMVGYDSANNLIGSYKYLDVRFNRGLPDELFSPKANGLDD